MKKLGYADPKWSLREAVRKQIELEDRVAWARSSDEVPKYVYKKERLHLGETASHVFGSAVQFISSIPKL
jgi:hypothetical protein